MKVLGTCSAYSSATARFGNLFRCAIGLLLAASLGAAELPAPLAAALGRLRTADAYAWTAEIQTPGAPFALAPIKGWASASGEGLLEATVERKTIQAAISGAHRVVNLGSDWKALSEVAQEKNLRGAEVARLLGTSLPAGELSALLEEATAIRTEADGTFAATLSADIAAEIVRSPMKNLPNRGFSPEIKGATASIKLWIKDSALQRYVISATASLSLPFGTREIKQASIVDLHEIDAAEAVLPPAALGKLQAITTP